MRGFPPARSLLTGALWLLAGGVLACSPDARADDARSEADTTTDAAASASADPVGRVINVEVMPVRVRDFTRRIRLTGTAEADRDVTVSAQESGQIEAILAEKGSRVEEGQPILRIDDDILRAEVKEARARARIASETYERHRRLFEERAISELALLEARYDAEELQARVDALETRLARTTIRSPITGVLESRFVEVGTSVAPGTEVARVVALDPVKVTAGVPERYAADVEPGSRARVTFDVLQGEIFEGRISYVGATVDARNRTFAVEFTIPNPRRAVKPQMVATMELVQRTLEDVIVVPQEALVRTEDGFVAFVIEEEEDGRSVVRSRGITRGPSQENEVVVEEGLAPGDRLVVTGQQQVAAGDRVRIVGTRTDPVTASP